MEDAGKSFIMKTLKTGYIVVGTGAGGPMAARELAMAGKELIIIEQGSAMSRFAGLDEMELGKQLYQDNGRFPRTEEGYSILRGFNQGGTTELAIGHGVRCFEEQLKNFGLDISPELNEIEKEIGVCEMPDSHIGPNAALLTGAADAMNLGISKWPKFIDFDKCNHCGRCVISCPRNAKWSSNRIMDQLRKLENVRILTETKGKHLKISGGRVRGVLCETSQGMLEINAEKVILSAGGLGTPVILQNSGIDAGQALYMDMFVIVYGRSSKFRPAGEPSMSTIFEEDRQKPYILAPHVDAALMFQGIKGWFGAKPPYGIMVKTRDKNSGRVDKKGRVFKHLEETDMHSLTEGEKLARRIMASAGVSENDITVSEPTGGHPGGTAAIGRVIKPNLECRAVKSLYVCDASVFPESPGKPPMISICALGKWLGRRLAEK